MKLKNTKGVRQRVGKSFLNKAQKKPGNKAFAAGAKIGQSRAGNVAAKAVTKKRK